MLFKFAFAFAATGFANINSGTICGECTGFIFQMRLHSTRNNVQNKNSYHRVKGGRVGKGAIVCTIWEHICIKMTNIFGDYPGAIENKDVCRLLLGSTQSNSLKMKKVLLISVS